MSTALRHGGEHSYEDYLAVERQGGVKHEYLAGQIYAMAGGTPEHAALQAAVIVALGGQLLGKPCRLHTSDLRVRVLATGLATYPDAAVVCGRSERDPDDPSAVTNPTVLIEVTSKSSAAYDRGDKREHCARIPALRAYVVVSHEERRIDLWTRTDGGEWSLRSARAGDHLELACIGCRLDVTAVYDAAAEPA